MRKTNADLLSDVAAYYSSKLAQHGATPRGVDWNGSESQTLRFEQLTKVIAKPQGFSVNDLGCGYGGLYGFLSERFSGFSYSGFDVSEPMVQVAVAAHRDCQNARFVLASQPDNRAHYGIASGIFNVRQSRSDNEWQAHVEATLDVLDRTSEHGFAFNCLTSYSDSDKVRAELYYASPGAMFDFCKRRYARNVALLHDYGLYEFTILVRKG